MKLIKKIMLIASTAAALAGCSNPKEENFRYTIDTFADLKVMRYQIPGWENLTLQQKEYAYHLAEAAKWGRDILWDQNCKDNLRVRHAVETILEKYDGGDRGSTEDYYNFLVYAKRLFFSNGIHHLYAEDKFFPACSNEYFKSLLEAVGADDDDLLDVIYNPARYPQRRSTESSGDIVASSAVNFYEGVTREEVEAYYASIIDKNDPNPISYGLNTKVVKADDGSI
ncbi:MAG: dihydrofolate reductase, partial [Bacteroidales bacterium]|nr:dihydrofolate reductase [Bacteroidales bacterium]